MIEIRTTSPSAVEMSWFAPICNGDTDLLGQMPDYYKSTWNNSSTIVQKADQVGYQNILCPSSFQVGQDTWTFASAVGPITKRINLLPAIRCGELHPAMLGRSIATLDHMISGRLTLNIISSNQPGEDLPSEDRYQRSREVLEILKQSWTQEQVLFQGQFYQLDLPSAPMIPYQQNGGPLLYFGGYSPPGIELCAQHCDVYLMWPETEVKLRDQMEVMSTLAAKYHRTVDFGLRIHVIVRETEDEARRWAKRLLSKLDDQIGTEIRNRALDAKSLGVSRQQAQRAMSDSEGYVEDIVWTGIGQARSGCGAALVGTPDQIIHKLTRYVDLGIRSFIFSGYPHLAECELFARYVLPAFKQMQLNVVQKRKPAYTPLTPLGKAKRR